MIDIVPYDAVRHRGGVRELLTKNGWEEHYIEGQLAGLDALAGESLPGTNGKVCVSETGEHLGGFVSVEYRAWNRLGQLQGLAVDPALKRRGIASELVHRAEGFVRAEGGRGLYADTPVANAAGRGFYEAGFLVPPLAFGGSYLTCWPFRGTVKVPRSSQPQAMPQ